MFLRDESSAVSSIPLYLLVFGIAMLIWFFFHSQHVIIVQTPRWRPMESYKVTVEVVPFGLDSAAPPVETKKDV
jgi:hypothetical protein